MLTKFLRKQCLTTVTTSLDLPVIQLQRYLYQKVGYKDECKKLVESLSKYGCAIVVDPRIFKQYNSEFIDIMEQYIDSRSKQHQEGKKIDDVYPEYGYQTGLCPSFASLEQKGQDGSQDQAIWRYRWRIGERPPGDRIFDPPRIVPKDFPDFSFTLDRFANFYTQTVYTVAEMSAIGLGLEQNTFTKLLKGGPIILSPTCTDYNKFEAGHVFQPYHYDQTFLSIHGRSRYPGLSIWKDKETKVENIQIPSRHQFLQIGIEFERLTGGIFPRNYHEVVCSKEAKEKATEMQLQGKIPWRISSTLYAHVRYDVMLEPLAPFATVEAKDKYPPVQAYQLYEQEVNKRFHIQQK